MQDYKPIDTLIANGEGFSRKFCLKTSQANEQMQRVPYASTV